MKSPFVPYLVLWSVAAVLFYLAPYRYAPPLQDVWRALIALNVATFLLFGFDKLIAGSRAERVPEKLLQTTAVLGSPVGALVAMNLFHHKTRKTPFQFTLAISFLIEGVIIFLLLYKFPWMGNWVMQKLIR